jgi:hypothetical protein
LNKVLYGKTFFSQNDFPAAAYFLIKIEKIKGFRAGKKN